MAINFGEWIRHNITAHDKSMNWLANQIGVQPSTISRWRSDHRQPNGQTLLKICIVLAILRDVPIDGIFMEACKALGVRANEFNIDGKKYGQVKKP
jgi:transcriptional regulator with XRE-family HTH domain